MSDAGADATEPTTAAPGQHDGQISRPVILRAALRIVDRDGVDGLSHRRVSAHLVAEPAHRCRRPAARRGPRLPSVGGNVIGTRENEPVQLPVMPPVSPMLAKPVRSIPPGASYEPKWDGFRTICFRDRDEVELGSRNERPMTRYFPELVGRSRPRPDCPIQLSNGASRRSEQESRMI